MSADRLVVLGSKGGPAIRKGGPSPTAHLLELGGRRIVVDCGLGVSRGLVEVGMQLKELDLIFLTHLHSDHVLELGPLIHTAWTSGLKQPVRVFGPPGTEHVWRNFVRSLDFDIEIRIADEGRPDIRELVTVDEFGPGEVLDEDGLTVSAMRVEHPPVWDAFALRFESRGRTVVFSGDTVFHPPLAAFAKGADILVHEAMLEAGIERLAARAADTEDVLDHFEQSHTPVEEAGRIATDAGVGRLVLGHLIPADDPEITQADWLAALAPTWSGPTSVAQDGLVVRLDGKEPEQ